MIRAVLWDADGVLQVLPPFATMWPFLDHAVREALIADVFGDLQAALRGERDMARHLDAAVVRHGVEAHRDAIAAVFAQLDPVPEGRAALAAVRDAGTPCVLATNQDTLRTRAMRRVYEPLVDRCYFSAELRHAKPEAAYFRHIAADLRVEVDELLFIDDSRDNVGAARGLGLQAEEWHHERDAGTLVALLRRHGVLPES